MAVGSNVDEHSIRVGIRRALIRVVPRLEILRVRDPKEARQLMGGKDAVLLCNVWRRR